jgi:hypothetical protein
MATENPTPVRPAGLLLRASALGVDLTVTALGCALAAWVISLSTPIDTKAAGGAILIGFFLGVFYLLLIRDRSRLSLGRWVFGLELSRNRDGGHWLFRRPFVVLGPRFVHPVEFRRIVIAVAVVLLSMGVAALGLADALTRTTVYKSVRTFVEAKLGDGNSRVDGAPRAIIVGEQRAYLVVDVVSGDDHSQERAFYLVRHGRGWRVESHGSSDDGPTFEFKLHVKDELVPKFR